MLALDRSIVTIITGFLSLLLSSECRQTRFVGIDRVQHCVPMTVRVRCLLIGLRHGEEHKDCVHSSEDYEEPKDPTPTYSSDSHKPCDQRRNLSGTMSEGLFVLNDECFRRLIVGPAKGQRAKNDRVLPWTSDVHKSPSIALRGYCRWGIEDESVGKPYPEFVSEEAAKNPPKKRKMSRAAVLGANAFPT